MIKIGNEICKYVLGSESLYQVELNSLGTSQERESYKKILKSYFSQPHIYPNLSEKSKNRLEKNVLRILDSKEEQDLALVEGAPSIYESLSSNSLEELEVIKKLLLQEKVPVKMNDRLVRGLDYYNGPCFEITPSQNQNLSMGTILAGGRYDLLADLIGSGGKGKYDIKSVGFAFGIERMMLAARDDILEASNQHPKIVILKIFEDVEESDYLRIETLIRSYFRDNHSELGLFDLFNCAANVPISCIRVKRKKIGQELAALSSRFSHAIIIGDDEIRSGKIKIKNLISKVETERVIDLT